MEFSRQQKKVLRFPYSDYDGIICDGAVRSGKTSVMSLSFFLWAMSCFQGCSFAFCGKSVGAVDRNIITPLLSVHYLQEQFHITYQRANGCLIVSRGKRENRFYLFGGKDESSASLIQGITLAGVFLDEVALMPRSFVQQALARCSVTGAKLWFNCNPENPMHWFRQEWILKAQEKNMLHLHFTMEDNPALDEKTRQKYHRLYSGIFYERFILGKWVMSEGLIYDCFSPSRQGYAIAPVGMAEQGSRTISVDYGTVNPTVFLDIYDFDSQFYVAREYRWDSRKEGRQKTDQEYVEDLCTFMGETPCTVLVDPSAASFIEALRRNGVYVLPAQNEVLNGIRKTASLFQQDRLHIHESCTGLMDELGVYLWDKQSNTDRPVKENDHGPDALRYFVNSLAEWNF